MRSPGTETAKPGPVWRTLAAQAGVQDFVYVETPRADVRALFGHPPKRLLDIGCATGATGAALKLALPGLWVWGCEPNARAADKAAQRLDRMTRVTRPEWNHDDIELVRTIDTVLLLDVLEHMHNPWEELEFLAQQLAADAQVIVSLPNVGHLSVLAELANGTFTYKPAGILDITHIRFFTFTEMMAMFEQTGFRVEATSILSKSRAEPISGYPTHVSIGRFTVKVENEAEWQRLLAVQFGFRLRLR